MTAGWMKIFSADPRLGFLTAADGLQKKISAGGPAAQLTAWQHQLFNNQVNAAVTGIFLVLVAVVVLTCARVWWQLLAGHRAPDLREEPYVPVASVQQPVQ